MAPEEVLPESTEQVTKLRTWRPIALWSAAILLALGLAWFVGAVAVPFLQARSAVELYSRFSMEDTGADEAIASLGDSSHAVRLLIIYLRAPSSLAGRKATATEMLGRLDAPAAVSPLLRALGDPDPEVRTNAADALGYVGRYDPKSSLTALFPALDDPDASVRRAAAETVGGFGLAAEPAVPGLVRLLADTDPFVRCSASSSLGIIGQEIGPRARAFVPDLGKLLTDTDKEVRWQVAQSLGQLGPPAAQAVPALIKALKDSDDSVRREVATALGSIGPPAKSALPALKKMLGDTSFQIREAVAEAMTNIRGEEAKP